MFLGGTQQLTLQDAEGLKTKLFPSVRKGARICTIAFLLAPQQAYSDPPSGFFHPIRAGKPPSESTWVSGAPQLADLTLQASIQEALARGDRPGESTFVSGAPQFADLTQQGSFQESASTPQIPPVGLPSAAYAWGTDLLARAARETVKSFIWKSQPAVSAVSGVPDVEYTWGGHAQALSSAEGAKSQVFPPAVSAVVVSSVGEFVATAPQGEDRPTASVWESVSAGSPPPVIGPLWASPQQYDLTQPAVFQEALQASRVPVIATILGGPLQVDLAQQAWFDVPALARQGAVPPLAEGSPQADPSQLAAQIWGSQPAAPIIPNPTARFFALPPQAVDLTQQAVFDAPALARQGPVPASTLASPQADPSQVAASVWEAQAAPPSVPGRLAKFVYSAASQPDASQAANVFALPTPSAVVPPPPPELGGGAGGGSKLPGQEAPQDADASPWKPPQWLLDRLDREEEERIRAEVERRQAILKPEASAEQQVTPEGLVSPRQWEGAEQLSADVIEKLAARQPIPVPGVLNDDEEVILLFLMDL